jgi:hypothetical protein
MTRGHGSQLAPHSVDTALWIARISGWIVLRGLIGTGWSHLPPPGTVPDLPPRPRLVLWRHAARTSLAGIERHLASIAAGRTAPAIEAGTAHPAQTEQE